MAGSLFCPLFSFGLKNCLQKGIVGFPPLKVNINDRTKCNLSFSTRHKCSEEFPGSTSQFQTWKNRDKILLLLVLSLGLFQTTWRSVHISGESLGSECSIVFKKIFASSLPLLFGFDTSQLKLVCLWFIFFQVLFFSNTSIKFGDLYVLQNLVINF